MSIKWFRLVFSMLKNFFSMQGLENAITLWEELFPLKEMELILIDELIQSF